MQNLLRYMRDANEGIKAWNRQNGGIKEKVIQNKK